MYSLLNDRLMQSERSLRKQLLKTPQIPIGSMVRFTQLNMAKTSDFNAATRTHTNVQIYITHTD